MQWIKRIAMVLGVVWMFAGCVPVKDYQKMYLNDQDMATSIKKMEVFESNFQTYREGPSGASGGKSGGGCGCN